MLHFLYTIKRSLWNWQSIFWVLVFPLFLGLVFKFMFGNLGQVEQFSKVAVGVIEDETDETFVDTLKDVEMEEDLPMFKVYEYEDVDEAEKALQKETIYAYVLTDNDDYTLIIREMDTRTSLIKSFVDIYKQNFTLITDMAENNPEQLENFTANLFTAQSIGVEEIELKGQDKSPYTQYFYALLAMTCLMASMFAVRTGINLQADASTLGARRNVAPTPKMQQFITDFLADFLLHAILMTIVLLIVIHVFGQDFGDNFGLILLASIAGSFAGLSAGFLIATWAKGSIGAKDGICCAFFMISSFLGGLQMAEMPYILEEKCPIINRINPATLIVNAYKSLAVFGDYRQYAINVVSLFVIGIIFIVFSIAKLRRSRYASL